MRTKILFFVSIATLGVLLAVLSVYISTIVVAADDGCIPGSDAVKLGGKAWNSTIGWIANNFDINLGNTKRSCGLGLKYVRKGSPIGEVTGWSWSRFGYICWGKTCKDHASADKAPNNREPIVQVYKDPSPAECTTKAAEQAKKNDDLRRELEAECNKTAANKVKGWVKILSLAGKKDDNGWVCLSPDTWVADSDQQTGCDTKEGDQRKSEYGLFYDPAKNEFKGKAWNATVGWIVFSGSTIAEADRAICESKADGIVALDPLQNRDALITLCIEDINNFSYNRTKQTSRWKTSYVGPGVHVGGGNVYSLSGFGSGSENNVSTVDFLIYTPKKNISWQELCREMSAAACKQFSKKIKEDSSDSDTDEEKESKQLKKQRRTKKIPVTYSDDDTGKREVTQPVLKRPEGADASSAVLRSSIGSLDIGKLIKRNAANKNSYGNAVKVLESPDAEITDAILDGGNGCNLVGGVQNCNALANTVIVVNNKNFHITNPMKFLNVADAAIGKGGVTFVVNGGNLKIDASVYYEQSQVNRLEKLPSVAWIVLKKGDDASGVTGNIFFNDCMGQSVNEYAAQAVGVFFAENKTYTGTGKYETTRTAAGAIASNGNDCSFAPSGAMPLQINGMMIAKGFVFERVYEGDGSEEINYDGRLLVSMPPGLSDVMKRMPTWSP